MATLTLSLVSHTNAGKTTLARTLLERDVGEVADRPHVTGEPERHVLLQTAEGDALVLWDTPGFGDTARLLRLLRRQENPLGWLASQVWDRFADRPLWSSQEAVRNVREEADLVLYLVNAAEDPEGAGYVEPEMQLLEWIGRPVIVLLNQTGSPRAPDARRAEAERWRAHLGGHAVVADALDLDAFTRCWVQEGVLLERVAGALPEASRPIAEGLLEAWTAENLEVFRRSMAALAGHLARAAADREPLGEAKLSFAERKRAAKALAERLQRSTRALVGELIALHGLEGASAAVVRTRQEDFAIPRGSLDPRHAGALGGAVGGALSGLATDIAAGGMTFGGGFVLGALLGGLGSAALARGFQLLKSGGRPAVSFSPEFLAALARDALLRYLAVAHYGRGRGEFREREEPAFWLAAVERALEARKEALEEAWALACEAKEGAADRARAGLERIVTDAAREVLLRFYPGVERFL